MITFLAQADLAAAAPKVDTYEDAVVRIWNYGTHRESKKSARSHGTGFFINTAGYLLTNHHVIDDSNWIGPARYEVVYPRTGAKEPVSVIWSDRDLDLALMLVASGKANATLKLEEPLAEKGTTVYAIGYPGVQDRIAGDDTKMMESTIASGDIANYEMRRWLSKYDRSLQVLGHTADIHGGNSGGPLINDCSHVVGVNTMVGFDVIDWQRGDRISAYKYASHIGEAIRELRAQNIAMDVITELCEPAPPDGFNPMSFANTAAILLLAGFLALLFFKQSRQAVVQGVQKSFVKISSIGTNSQSARPPPAPAGGTPVGAGQAVQPSTRPLSEIDRVKLVPQNAAAAAMNFDLAREWLSQQEHGISFGREARIVDNVIRGDGISRRHFRLSFDHETCFLEDLNSAGGTSVNGAPLQPYYAEGLKDGDSIAAGSCQWQVRLN